MAFEVSKRWAEDLRDHKSGIVKADTTPEEDREIERLQKELLSQGPGFGFREKFKAG